MIKRHTQKSGQIGFNNKQLDQITDIFADSFHEVMMPALEDLPTKLDLKKIEEKINRVDDRVEAINKRVIQITDHHAVKLDNYEKRIGKLETKSPLN